MPPLNKSRDSQHPTNPPRPLMPALAPGRNVKSPITPRLAGQYQTPTVAKTARSNTPSTIKSGPTKDDLSTPVKALISSNITPRSSSRRLRTTDISPNGTPNDTPTGTRPSSVVEGPASGNVRRPLALSTLGTSSNGNAKSRPANVVVGGYSGTTSPSIGSAGLGSMFFHAEEMPPPQEPAKEVKKSPVFFYANGQHEDVPSRALSNPSPPLSNISTSRSQRNQFFRADGTEDEDIPPVPSLPSPPINSPSPMPFLQAAPMFRAPSPTKEGFNLHLSYRKGASQIMRPDNRPKAVSIHPPASLNHPRQRSTSSGLSNNHRHGRTSSLSSVESASSSNRKTSLTANETCGLTPLQISTNLANVTSSPGQYSSAPPSARMPSPVPEMTDKPEACSPKLSTPQSPSKPTWPPQNLPESVMNARVERKIQDLEISNSSLMAINRSLEKEVRRQKKELRHFRRLSRAGRLSGISMITDMTTDADDDEDDEDAGADHAPLAALSEEDEDDLSEDEDDLSTDSSSGAESDSKKLAKDSRRLQIDLSKHRELLVDSQKMNQSLKRCMAWTENLIREGKRALEYKVNVSDVQLGGRVLDPVHAEDEEEEQYEADHSLLSTWSATATPILDTGKVNIDINRKSWNSEEADSGIEIDSARGSRLPHEGLEELHDLISDLTVCGDNTGEPGVS